MNVMEVTNPFSGWITYYLIKAYFIRWSPYLVLLSGPRIVARQVTSHRREPIILLNGHSIQLTPNDLLLYPYISAPPNF